MVGPWELLIILAIVIVIFGAKRLKSLGSDLGSAIKNFKSSMRDEEAKPDENAPNANSTPPSDKKH
jgi:sec-independent protein translocase protein TatA